MKNRKPPETRVWSWGLVLLSAFVPFAVDMLRNFQLFTPRQIALSGLTIFGAAALLCIWIELVALIVTLRRPRARTKGVVHLCNIAAAAVFAAFLFDANLSELRLTFAWPLPAAVLAVLALLLMYWWLATTLGARKASLLLLGLLLLRSAQAIRAIAATTPQGDDLVSAEAIHIYERVRLREKPNIYFVCLESYSGFTAMQELFGFDNAEFKAFLHANNFIISEPILSNYSFTMVSLQAFFQMGHHYAAGSFGNHDSLHACGFLSGSKTYYNPVLRILKNNGYAIVYLLPSDYYYRPGAGLVDESLLAGSWPLAPLKVSLRRFIGREPKTGVPAYKQTVRDALGTWKNATQPAFFFIKMGAEHALSGYDFRSDRDAFVARYEAAVSRENPDIEALVQQIIAQDPAGIVILAGDHGPQSYRAKKQSFTATKNSGAVSAARLVADSHDVLLAIRWGAVAPHTDYAETTLVNVMRHVFWQLSGDPDLRATTARNSTYLSDRGGLRHVAEDGHARDDWPLVPRPGWR